MIFYVLVDDDDFNFFLIYELVKKIFSSLWRRNRVTESLEDFGVLVEEAALTLTVYTS